MSTPTVSKKDNAAKRELVAFRVDEVSLVDAPAIEEDFAVIKSKDSISKNAPQHQALLSEKLNALGGKGTEIAALAGSNSPDFRVLMEKLADMSELLWQVKRDSRTLAAIAKSRDSDDEDNNGIGDALGGIAAALGALGPIIGGAVMAKQDSKVKTDEELEDAKAKKAKEDKELEDEKAKKAKASADESEEDEKAKKAKKAEDEDEDEAKAKGKTAKRFTTARMAKLASALSSLVDVMKEVDATSLSGLIDVTKGVDGGKLIAKCLRDIGVTPDSVKTLTVSQELASLQKRMSQFEAAGVTKSLGDDGKPVEKSNKESIFKGVL